MKTKMKGQSLVEFALILPILLLLLLGIIEGGRIIWAYVQVNNAAREAARYAISGQPWGRGGSPGETDCAMVDGSSEGDPWTCTEEDRVARIKQVAFNYTTGLNIAPAGSSDFAGQGDIIIGSADEYELYSDTPDAFGVRVSGQRRATDTFEDMEVNYPSQPGLVVFVEAYYNVRILDPIIAALLPRDWVRINAQLSMQNEGVDTTASGLAPVGLGAAPTPVGGGDDPGGGSGRVPKISVVQAQPVAAGTTITIRLEEHEPSTTYDVYFDDQYAGTVTTNAQFFAQIDYYLPLGTAPGAEHSVHSELPGTGSAVASAPVEVSGPIGPAIEVVGGTRWPAGSPITIRIFNHGSTETCGIFAGGSLIGTITTDTSGYGSLAWTIPSVQALGELYIESRLGVTPLANTKIRIVDPQIVVQGGTVWPAGTRIYIFLRDHAPSQTYSVYFDSNLVSAAVTTNAIGEAILSYVIPSGTADGTYALKSQQGSTVIEQINIRIETPDTPFIVVVGGYEWPAGSPITIQLRKHLQNTEYDVRFGDENVGRFTTDGGGDYTIAYVIPVNLGDLDGELYNLRSLRAVGGNQDATVNVKVWSVPNITIDGGSMHAPGETITIRLNRHAPIAAYDVYVSGLKIGWTSTDPSGLGTLTYTIPASAVSGEYLIESRPKDEATVVASTMLRVVAPDLVVLSIETPANPVFNTPMPITITLKNNSDKAISNQYFDVDLYIDPTLSPTSSDAGLPPGARKYWYNSLPASGTLTIYDTVTLWGAKAHNVYARADTSGAILETSENNNILGKIVSPAGCSLEIADEFEGSGMPVNWGSQFYGNADGNNSYNLTDPEVYQSGGQLFVKSEGRDTTMGDDNNGSNAGYAFIYREASGDFDVYIQVVDNAYSYSTNRRSGLEVRDDLGGTALKLNVLLVSGNTVRVATRSNNNVASVSPATPNPDYPIWLRLVRRGNTFSAYYAPGTAGTPPQPNQWIFVRDVDVTMDGTVYVGLVNAAQYWNSTRSRNWSSTNFDHFHYCGDPAGALACGEVKETEGVLILNAVNYTDNLVRGGVAWAQTTRAGLAGMYVPDANAASVSAGQAPSNSPELQYQAKFSTAGRYYLALLGWGNDTDSDSVHLGLNGSITSHSDDLGSFTTSVGNPPQWIRNADWYVDIPAAGSYTLNLYMREDGAQVYKLALFTQVDYPLDSFGPEQSECVVTAPQDIPPGLTVCNQVLVNGDFEGGLLTDVLPYWTMAEQEMVGRTNVHYITPGTSFGVIMPSSDAGTGTPKQPWMYQEFAMPTWVLSNTTMVLDLRVGVDWLGSPQNEPLYFYLRTTGGVTLTNPVLVRSGQDLPDLDPGNYNNNSWSRREVDVTPAMAAAGYSPVNFAAQTLQAYFYSPNPGSNSSEFYMDKIEFDVCTTQPLPSPITSTLRGKTIVNQSLKPGVNLWAYKMQSGGSGGGPVYTTYSIQDGTYHFYNLPAGTYLIYAEYWLGSTRYWAQAYATMPPNEVTKDVVLYP